MRKDKVLRGIKPSPFSFENQIEWRYDCLLERSASPGRFTDTNHREVFFISAGLHRPHWGFTRLKELLGTYDPANPIYKSKKEALTIEPMSRKHKVPGKRAKGKKNVRFV